MLYNLIATFAIMALLVILQKHRLIQNIWANYSFKVIYKINIILYKRYLLTNKISSNKMNNYTYVITQKINNSYKNNLIHLLY